MNEISRALPVLYLVHCDLLPDLIDKWPQVVVLWWYSLSEGTQKTVDVSTFADAQAPSSVCVGFLMPKLREEDFAFETAAAGMPGIIWCEFVRKAANTWGCLAISAAGRKCVFDQCRLQNASATCTNIAANGARAWFRAFWTNQTCSKYSSTFLLWNVSKCSRCGRRGASAIASFIASVS